MRSPLSAATEAGADRKHPNSSDTIADDIADRQASKIARFHLIGYATAATIAHLAYGVARP